MSSGYYDTFEAAKLLGVEPTTIRSWVKRGQLPRGRYVGRTLRWTKAQLLAARDGIAGRAVTAAPSTIRVIEVNCGCGAAGRAVEGGDGYLLVECPQCGSRFALQTETEYVYRRDIQATEVAPSADPEAVMGSKAAMVEVAKHRGQPLVYFIRLGPYVKIGTSMDVRGRLGSLALAPGNLLAVVPGSYSTEKAMHKRFARLRSFREWFYLQDELLDYVTELQRGHIQALVDAASGSP